MKLHIIIPRFFLKIFLRIIPIYRGGVRIAQSKIFKRLTSTDELLTTRLRTGPYIVVNLNDYIGRSIYYWGDYDRKITYICTRLLKTGDCFLDIGANVADIGLSAASVVGASGQVHIFEPQAQLCAYIRKSAELNHFCHIHIHEIALSDQNNECLLSIPYDNTGAATLSSKKTDNAYLIRVRARKAEDYLRTLNLPRIKAIKLDIEGHEEKLLKGAYDYLVLNKPAAIIFESHNNRIPFFIRGEVKILKKLGYSFFQIRQRPLFRVVLKELSTNDTESGYDFIALLKTHVDYYRQAFSII